MPCLVNLDKQVNMNMNYSYQATMYESILTQMCVFLVLFTIFAFYHEKILKPKLQKKCVTTNMYIWAKILSYIVVREL